ncbi:MAG TPA: GTP 3',8-cyclase MoaA [Blastocatellia bacterium]|nr:GTP 3',8-cyclase MoaA [Blastocatellia bacterium]
MLTDKYNRPIKDLRISVTDRCNFRCTYCMPLDEYAWIDRAEILTFEEIERLAAIFINLGAEEIRLTGGEPLLRRNIENLVAKLAVLPGLKDLSMTTNGSSLAEKATALKSAGLSRVNVSIDTLDPEKFKRMSKRGDLARVLDGVFAAKGAGLNPIKINAVIERGVNDDGILDLVEFARTNGLGLRFIEFMDVGNSNHWQTSSMVSGREILDIIGSRYPIVEHGRRAGTAPSVDFEFLDGSGDVGIIASVTQPFCSSCTRARLTADGKLVTCLFSESGHDLKAMMRQGASDTELTDQIAAVWRGRTDRFSDERLEALQSSRGYQPEARKKIEMIKLGG